MSEKEKNRENNQKKCDLQDRLIDYAVRFWLPSSSLVTNRCVVENNSTGKINSTFNKDELISILLRALIRRKRKMSDSNKNTSVFIAPRRDKWILDIPCLPSHSLSDGWLDIGNS